jgi:hypothetical protein
MKITPLRAAELFHAGGRTDRLKLTVVFSILPTLPKTKYALLFYVQQLFSADLMSDSHQMECNHKYN